MSRSSSLRLAMVSAALLVAALQPRAATADFGQLIVAPTGVAAGDQFGDSVATATDFDGDGFIDFVVGAPASGAPGNRPGAVYVYFGGPSGDDVPDAVFVGEADGDRFGEGVAAGDFDGDGDGDLLVGAPANDAAGVNAGRAYVFLGGPGADAIADLVLSGEAAGDHFGSSVGSAGRFSQLGRDDLVVGAPNNATAAFAAGRAYVYFGLGDDVADLVLTGEQDSDYFGVSVASAGRFDLDLYDDLVVGAPGSDAGAFAAGRAYVFSGGPGADATPDFVLTSTAPLDNFGTSVASAGDFDGDGGADVIVGASHLNSGPGRAYLFHGGFAADDVPDLVLNGETGGSQFGASVSAAGDVNGDFADDVVVGAPGTYGSVAGRAYVFYGGLGADAVADLVESGEAVGDAFGTSVAAAGDWNDDGLDDFLVGAPFNDAAGPDAGRAYLFSIALPTPVLVSRFEARPVERGIELRWLEPGTSDAPIALERATSGSAGWTRVAVPYAAQGDQRVVVDGDAVPGTIYWYRLVTTRGAFRVLAAIEASMPANDFAWSLRVSPNPISREAIVRYTIPRAGPVRLGLLDVSGREVAVLASGVHAAGEHRRAWSETSEPVRAAGVYFLRLSSSGRAITRRVVVTE